MSSKTRPCNVLFLCTGNSARSIIAEAVLNHWGGGRFRGYSAGSFPTGRVHPLALETLARMGIPSGAARSKGWDEFTGPSGVEFDLVITVCDRAAGETCPVWLGQPVTAHWGLPDPAAAAGDEAARRLAFDDVFRALEHRIRILVGLPFAALDGLQVRRRLDEIGRSWPAAGPTQDS